MRVRAGERSEVFHAQMLHSEDTEAVSANWAVDSRRAQDVEDRGPLHRCSGVDPARFLPASQRVREDSLIAGVGVETLLDAAPPVARLAAVARASSSASRYSLHRATTRQLFQNLPERT